MLRIHFTAEDIARTTLAAEPDPLWEVLLSLHMLQVEDGPLAYGAWRQRMRRRLPGRWSDRWPRWRRRWATPPTS